MANRLTYFVKKNIMTLFERKVGRTDILIQAAFAAAGVCTGAFQGLLLYCVLSRITGAKYAAAAVFILLKLAVYAAVIIAVMLLFRERLIAFGAGLGAGIFVSAVAASVISLSRNK